MKSTPGQSDTALTEAGNGEDGDEGDDEGADKDAAGDDEGADEVVFGSIVAAGSRPSRTKEGEASGYSSKEGRERVSATTLDAPETCWMSVEYWAT